MCTLIYGYGISGKSALNLLCKQNKKVVVYDENLNVDLPNGIKNVFGKNIDEILQDVRLIVVSPSIKLDSELLIKARKKNIEIISELELGFRNIEGDVIAVTGTNGKTTTVELLTYMLKQSGLQANYYGNIGIGLAENSSKIEKGSVAVVEASSFQLASVDLFCPKIAICLNISDDHLEYHKTITNYINCKANIFKRQDKQDYAILNYDDSVTRELAFQINSNVYYFSRKYKVKGCYVCANGIYFNDKKTEYVCSVDDINIKGLHNLENALACITACKILNIPNSIIVSCLEKFTLSEHRIQLVFENNGVKYFNDSKSTNIKSVIAGCKSMQGTTTLLLGGYDKGLNYENLFSELPIKVRTIICFGENKQKLLQASKNFNAFSVISADNLEDAIIIATKVRCDNVLFSPGTSSFDSFKNYMERGDYFAKCVKRLFSVEK